MEKIQVIKCKAGHIFAGCKTPNCYTDKDWLKEMRIYVEKKGCTVDYVNIGEFEFGHCECEKVSNLCPLGETNLFNQTAQLSSPK